MMPESLSNSLSFLYLLLGASHTTQSESLQQLLSICNSEDRASLRGQGFKLQDAHPPVAVHVQLLLVSGCITPPSMTFVKIRSMPILDRPSD